MGERTVGWARAACQPVHTHSMACSSTSTRVSSTTLNLRLNDQLTELQYTAPAVWVGLKMVEECLRHRRHRQMQSQRSKVKVSVLRPPRSASLCATWANDTLHAQVSVLWRAISSQSVKLLFYAPAESRRGPQGCPAPHRGSVRR